MMIMMTVKLEQKSLVVFHILETDLNPDDDDYLQLCDIQLAQAVVWVQLTTKTDKWSGMVTAPAPPTTIAGGVGTACVSSSNNPVCSV